MFLKKWSRFAAESRKFMHKKIVLMTQIITALDYHILVSPAYFRVFVYILAQKTTWNKSSKTAYPMLFFFYTLQFLFICYKQ